MRNMIKISPVLVAAISAGFISKPFLSSGQDTAKISYISVVVDEINMPVVGASVTSSYSEISTFTDETGRFRLDLIPTQQELIIEYPGTEPFILMVDPGTPSDTLRTYLTTSLEGVVIEKRRKSTEFNMIDPVKSENMGLRELSKAACCNLSESFETTPSVDVGFTDAISGYKQISLLGLSGPNVAFTRENIPDTRGLANIVGLTFTPGPWVESIQLSKGTGSVVNGYEGVAGQINVELHKPKEKNGIKLLLNAYQSTQGRTEANMVYNQIINSKWNTTLLAHVKSNWMNVDQNNDSFLDQPLGSTYLLGNRWMYYNPQGWEIQLGLKGVYMDLWGGESSYNRNQEVSTSSPWGFYNNTQRAEAWAKIGKIYTDKPFQSMGLQLNAFYHDQDARYGLNTYQGKQKSFYANYIFQSIIHSTEHTIKFGGSFQYDDFDEAFASQNYARQEIVPGIFTEYAYNYLDKFSVVAGIRGDYNNIYGAFLTPRLHLRFAPEEKLVFRASIGRAQRTVNVFAEHIGFMASNRTFELPGNNNQLPFGLKPEVAWNMGVNMVKQFMLNYRDGSLSLDYYYTHFDNMVLTDIEQYRTIRFYNLDGKSYAHSFQAQLDYEVMRKWDWRIAYRWYDVKATYEGKGLLQKPLLAAHRFFVNTAYETRNNWSFDLTANWTGAKRMPEHILNSGGPVRSSYATPSFWILNGQVSKSWEDERWKIYAGVENILGTMQHHLILGRQDPYAEGFDAGLVWGSAMGRNIYIGMNYQIK